MKHTMLVLAPAILVAGLCAAPSRANDVVTVGIPGPVQVSVGGVLVTVGQPPTPRVVVVTPAPPPVQRVVYVHDRPSVVYVHPRDSEERVVTVYEDDDSGDHCRGHGYGKEKHKKHREKHDDDHGYDR